METLQIRLPKTLQLINEKDAPFLAAGLQKEIDAVITGDKDFLENPRLKKLRKKKIFTTRAFLTHH